jgi:hypothetical protein
MVLRRANQPAVPGDPRPQAGRSYHLYLGVVTAHPRRVSPRKERADQQRDQSTPCSATAGKNTVDLVAPRFASHAPFAEMFAVIREHVVAIFAKPRASSMHDFIPVELAWFLETKPDWVSPGELRQSNLLYGPSTQPEGYSAVLHNPTATHINAVMRITPARRHHVCTEGWLARRIKRVIDAAWIAAMAARLPKALRLVTHTFPSAPELRTIKSRKHHTRFLRGVSITGWCRYRYTLVSLCHAAG